MTSKNERTRSLFCVSENCYDVLWIPLKNWQWVNRDIVVFSLLHFIDRIDARYNFYLYSVAWIVLLSRLISPWIGGAGTFTIKYEVRMIAVVVVVPYHIQPSIVDLSWSQGISFSLVRIKSTITCLPLRIVLVGSSSSLFQEVLLVVVQQQQSIIIATKLALSGNIAKINRSYHPHDENELFFEQRNGSHQGYVHVQHDKEIQKGTGGTQAIQKCLHVLFRTRT